MALVSCAKCQREYNSREGVVCSSCKKHYEFDCAGISEKLYLLMDSSRRKNWKCKLCIQSKSISEKSNITIRKQRNTKKTDKNNYRPQTQPETFLNLNAPSTSHDVLSDKSKKSPPAHYDSHILSDDDTIYDLNESKEILTRSLVDIANHNILIEEMKVEISTLKSSLGTTQEELENTIIEKNAMERTISKLIKDIQLLKNICQSPRKNLNVDNEDKRQSIYSNNKHTSIIATPSKKERADNNKEMFELEKKVLLLQHELTLAKTEIANLNRELDRCLKVINQSKRDRSPFERIKVRNLNTQQNNTKPIREQNPKIFIYGTQQCRGLAATLIKAKRNTQQAHYDVSSIIKPNAFTKDIIRDIHITNIQPSDKLLLSIGENDLNPKQTVLQLRKCLQSLGNKTVIVLQVVKNYNVDSDYLNTNIERLCNQFINCRFMSVKRFAKSAELSKKILCTIGHIDYDREFLYNVQNRQPGNDEPSMSVSSKEETPHKLSFNELQSTPKSDFFRFSR